MKVHPRLYWLALIIGFVSLLIETVSFNVTYFYVVDNSYVTALVLSSFLTGMAVASLLFSYISSKIKNVTNNFIVILLVSVLGYLFVLYIYPDLLRIILETVHIFILFDNFYILIIWLFLFIPGFLVGAGLPALLELQKNSHEDTRPLSTLYAVDVAGGIVGTLLTGFILLPNYGVKATILVGLFSTLAALLLVIPSLTKILFKKKLNFLILILAFSFFYIKQSDYHSNDLLIPYDDRFGEIIFQEPSPFGTVTIGRYFDGNNGYNKAMYINYRNMCLSVNHEAEKFIAYTAIKNLERNNNNKILAIGLGCGFTLDAILESDRLSLLDVYEINPVIADNVTQYFFSEENNPIFDERVNLFIEDGLRALRIGESGTYDAVIIDVEEPGVIQSSPLYTYEYFLKIKDIMQDKGVVSMWAIRGGDTYNKILYKTLSSVFDNVYIVVDEYENIQIFAANHELVVDNSFTYTNSELYDVPINKLFNNVLQSNYSITKAFSLPENFEDSFIE